jgi:tetratricopeptide (TPR) repeat protein
MLAELAARIGRYVDAAKLLRRALELSRSFTAARYNLATVLYRNNQLASALAELDVLLAHDQGNPAFHNLAAAAAMRIGATVRAIDHFERALAVVPDQSKLWMSYGHALKTAGRSGEGVAAYRRALELDPLLGEAWWSLANLKTMRFTPEDVAAMERARADPACDEEGGFHVAFALGKALEDAGRHDVAFAAYAEGNFTRRAGLDYDAEAQAVRVDQLCAALTPALFAAHAGAGCPAPDPIFVVGMPRSGSTLIEQILASHPMIEGTQELPDIHALALRVANGREEEGYAGRLADLDAETLRALGEEYLERTRIQRTQGRPLFIDKMPNNWQHVGLIRLILPNATIIDARRHPLACCFSNFKQHFARGQAFSYDLKELGRYYRDYVRMMAHVDAVLPGYVHRVLYEDMVADTEGEVRRLLDHVGVPFDAACLSFHRTERAVRTASSEQVRRPIFRDGLDQWRPFEPWLGPLADALGDVLDCYPDVPDFPTRGVR